VCERALPVCQTVREARQLVETTDLVNEVVVQVQLLQLLQGGQALDDSDPILPQDQRLGDGASVCGPTGPRRTWPCLELRQACHLGHPL
jgi:hypothetical protein